MIDLSKLRYKLMSLRAEKGVSQYRVAKDTGLGEATVCNHESGRRNPNLLAVVAYAEYYGVTVSELLGETDGKEKTN